MCPQLASASTAAAASEERIRVWRFMAFLLLGFPWKTPLWRRAAPGRGPGIPQRSRWNISGLVDVAPRSLQLPGAVFHVGAIRKRFLDFRLGVAHVGCGLVDDGLRAGWAFLA